MNKNKTFIIISVVVILLDLIFISINYNSSKSALSVSILELAKKEEANFKLVLATTYRSLSQTSMHFSQHEDLNELFLQGKKAVEEEGGSAGGIKAQETRQKILDIVKDHWDLMMHEFGFRQFQYHLGPGSLSFLRVHKPSKFGDRMDAVRHTVVDTNREKTSRTGFETGRVYSGLRSVVPIWSIDPETNKNVYVGALEIGTSFDQLLTILSKNSTAEADFSVLLNKEHIKQSVWPEFYQKKLEKSQRIDYFVESSTISILNIQSLLKNNIIPKNFQSNEVNVSLLNGQYLATYSFPFKDYIATKNAKSEPVGFVLISQDVTKQVDSFYHNFYINILLSLFGLIIIEITLLLLFKYESKLKKLAAYDYLTGLPNRSYFAEYAEMQLALAKRKNEKVAILFIDLDDFKAINDGISHNAGDLVLKTIAKRCKAFVRKNEFIARVGGDEFCMVIYGYQNDLELEEVAARLIAKCSDKIMINTLSIKQKISIGIARYPLDANSLDGLIKKADTAMYSVKENKKGTFAFI